MRRLTATAAALALAAVSVAGCSSDSKPSKDPSSATSPSARSSSKAAPVITKPPTSVFKGKARYQLDDAQLKGTTADALLLSTDVGLRAVRATDGKQIWARRNTPPTADSLDPDVTILAGRVAALQYKTTTAPTGLEDATHAAVVQLLDMTDGKLLRTVTVPSGAAAPVISAVGSDVLAIMPEYDYSDTQQATLITADADAHIATRKAPAVNNDAALLGLDEDTLKGISVAPVPYGVTDGPVVALNSHLLVRTLRPLGGADGYWAQLIDADTKKNITAAVPCGFLIKEQNSASGGLWFSPGSTMAVLDRGMLIDIGKRTLTCLDKTLNYKLLVDATPSDSGDIYGEVANENSTKRRFLLSGGKITIDTAANKDADYNVAGEIPAALYDTTAVYGGATKSQVTGVTR